MVLTAQKIAEFINGELIGEPNRPLNSIAKIEEATEMDLSFLSNPKYVQYLDSTSSKVVIISRGLWSDSLSSSMDKTFIIVEDAHNSFVQLLQVYNQMMAGEQQKGIHPTAIIETEHNIPDTAYIGPYVHIKKNTRIGDNCIIHAHVTIDQNSNLGNHVTLHSGVKIMHSCQLGNNITVHSNTVIGSDGFGFLPNAQGVYSKVPQIGNVIIHDDVEIGANTTVDRATMGSTIIHQGVKIDNHVQISHNVVIGENTVIAAQAGISGSTKIGKNCIIGGQVGIVGHITIADFTQINAQSGVAKPIKEKGTKLTGSPAFDYSSALRSQVVFKSLPDLKRRIEDLEAHIKNLDKN